MLTLEDRPLKKDLERNRILKTGLVEGLVPPTEYLGLKTQPDNYRALGPGRPSEFVTHVRLLRPIVGALSHPLCVELEEVTLQFLLIVWRLEILGE